MPRQNTLAAALQTSEDANNPVVVYERVTRAWQLLMGDDLHFGYFETPQTPLSIATVRLTQEMAVRAQLRQDMRILDVGCGIGGPALFLAQRVGCHVTGISTSKVGVQLATSRAEAHKLSDLAEFVERDGMANGFSDETFDAVWIMESSHLMERKDLLMAESIRALRPNGLLILCDIMVRTPIPFQDLVRNLSEFENLNSVFGKQHVELLSVYTQVAENNGLTVLRSEDISEAVLPTLEQWRRNAESHNDEVQELIGEDYLARFVRACGFLQLLWKQEKLGYGIVLCQRDL